MSILMLYNLAMVCLDFFTLCFQSPSHFSSIDVAPFTVSCWSVFVLPVEQLRAYCGQSVCSLWPFTVCVSASCGCE